MDRDVDGKIICPHNHECRCTTPECHKCGWNPEVAERRLKEFREGHNVTEKLYKIPFTGYCEVWAKSPEEAAEKAETVEQQFFAHYDFGDPECSEKEEKNELD
jgi:hypothetical protein